MTVGTGTGAAPTVQSAIDLGTNTVLMVTGRRRGPGATPADVEILDDAHAIARLGKGVDAGRRILPETVDRACALLLEYRRRAERSGSGRLRAFGTSALRDAANKERFISAVAERAGVDLTELSGQEEAALTFTGAAFGLHLPDRYAVLDLGGGSTEVAIGDRRARVEASTSVNVGAVRVTERFFPGDGRPPTAAQRRQAEAMIAAALDDLPPLPLGIAIVGVAGTVTTLGALDKGLSTFDAESLNGYVLTTDAVARLCDRLLALTLEQIRALPPVSEQRADIIAAGALILRTYLERFGVSRLLVSTRGIRYGLLLEMLAGRL